MSGIHAKDGQIETIGSKSDAKDAADAAGSVIAQLRRITYELTAWTPRLLADETTGDSDKTFTVDTDKHWKPLTIWVELTTSATVGNRQLAVQFLDSASDVIGGIVVGAVQAESTTRNYIIGVGLPDLTAFRDTDFLMTPLPENLRLPAGYQVRIYDNKAIDAAADNMIVQMLVLEKSL